MLRQKEINLADNSDQEYSTNFFAGTYAIGNMACTWKQYT